MESDANHQESETASQFRAPTKRPWHRHFETVDRSRQTVAGRIIAAGAVVEPFSFRWADEAAADAIELMEGLTRQWSIEVCYGSTLGDCWTTNADREAPSEINSCDAVAASDL